MTNEDKKLLLIELCARLPYGVKCQYNCIVPGVMEISNAVGEFQGIVPFDNTIGFMIDFHKVNALYDNIKPYLRPMSSMTEEEQRELQSFFPSGFGNQWLDIKKGTIEIFDCPSTMTLYLNDSKRVIDFFNSHHIDYLGFIERGLALEASSDMYKTK